MAFIDMKTGSHRHESYERVDDLGWQGWETPLMGPETACYVSFTAMGSDIGRWLQTKIMEQYVRKKGIKSLDVWLTIFWKLFWKLSIVKVSILELPISIRFHLARWKTQVLFKLKLVLHLQLLLVFLNANSSVTREISIDLLKSEQEIRQHWLWML